MEQLKLKKGEKYRIFFNDNNLNNKTIYIRGIIDKEYVVYKQWFKRKKKWNYQIDHICYLQFLAEDNVLTKLK